MLCSLLFEPRYPVQNNNKLLSYKLVCADETEEECSCCAPKLLLLNH